MRVNFGSRVTSVDFFRTDPERKIFSKKVPYPFPNLSHEFTVLLKLAVNTITWIIDHF